MRFLSLSCPRLATDRIARASSPRDDAPCVTVVNVKGAYRIAALNAQATRLGLKSGTALADARAMVPTLAIHAADPAGETRTLLDLTDWCRLFTPLAAPDAPDGAMLDISGAAHLFGGEAKLLDTLIQRLGGQGFLARAAIAGSPAAAWALARYGKTSAIIPEDMPEYALAKLFGPLPLAALRLAERTIAQLGQAGLRRIDDLVLRPRAPIAARFGSAVYQRLDEILGRSRAPITPRFEAPAFLAERRFAEGLARRVDIEATILTLCHDLCGLLAGHGEGARRLDVSLFRVDGAVRHVEAGTSRPLRDPQTMARLFRDRIEAMGEDGLDTGYGFDVIRLAALESERLDQHQPDWDAGGARTDDLADLVDRLAARFGQARVKRLAARETHNPERATTTADAMPDKTTSPHRHAVRRGPKQSEPPRPLDNHGGSGPVSSRPPYGEGETGIRYAHPWAGSSLPVHTGFSPALPERPIRLLRRPEPIETIAGVPDGPPLRFRWRRVLHLVGAIEGPERIGPEWWKRRGPVRDYFRAEDTAGQRFWLFREGLYQETPEPCWFMHGLFA